TNGQRQRDSNRESFDHGLLQSFPEESEVLGGVTCQSSKAYHRFTSRCQHGVVWQRDCAEPLLFHLLKATIDFAPAVGVKAHTHVAREFTRDVRTWKHVGFHPAAIRTGIPREVDQDRS